MIVTIHETAAGYECEYREVRANLVRRGTNVAAWARANGYSRQLVVQALKGRSFGRKALEARAKIIQAASNG